MLIIWMFPRDQLFRGKTNILSFESWLDPNITLFWFNNNKSEKIKESINNNNVPDKRWLATWKFPLDPKKMVSWKHSNDKYALRKFNFLGFRTKVKALVSTQWRNFENRMIFELVARYWKNTVDSGTQCTFNVYNRNAVKY